MINTLARLMSIMLITVSSKVTSTFFHKGGESYLDRVVGMITKASSQLVPQCECVDRRKPLVCECNERREALDCASNDRSEALDYASNDRSEALDCECEDKRKASDCSDVLEMGNKKSGVYTIWPASRLMKDKSLEVYCDLKTDGGGWTVIQRRGNFGRSRSYFYKGWKSYKEGFGDIKKDFWLGNDNIFCLTNQKLYSASFDLIDVEMKSAYARYDKFWIDDESRKYMLHISGYSGNAGDSMIEHHDRQKFSTKDQDNDQKVEQQCACVYKGAWWYNSCHSSNLNGMYLHGKHDSFADGVNWKSFKGFCESLESTEIKIRPKAFTLPRASYDHAM